MNFLLCRRRCLAIGLLTRGSEHGASPLIGRLFPQPKVRCAGREGLLDDFLGDGFALLSLPQTPPNLFDQLPAELWLPLNLQRVAIRAPGDSTPAPNGVTSLFDVEGEFSHSMRNFPPGLVLLRPDRYVAAYLPAENLEAGVRGVDDLIAWTWKHVRN